MSRHLFNFARAIAALGLSQGSAVELPRTTKVQASSTYGILSHEERRRAKLARRRITWGPNAWKPSR